MLFERGFKSWCEKMAKDVRRKHGLEPAAPIDPRKLASGLSIEVLSARNVAGLSKESAKILFNDDHESWSAITICVGNRKRILLNPSHSAARQASDLMHELAHHILNHNPNDLGVSDDGMLLMHVYDIKQEAEADWLAGCMLLPRDALVTIKQRRIAPEDAAQVYGVSRAMLKYRLAITGVNYQFT